MSAALKLQAQTASPQTALLTWEEYEEGEQSADVRHEFVDGQVYGMAGATDNHNRISGDIFVSLRQQLRGKSCEPFINDMKIKLQLGLSIRGYYPDVMVVCNPEDNHPLHRQEPTVVFEVLSESTERVDRQEKLQAYTALPSLQVYVLAEQKARALTVYRRSKEWQPEHLIGNATLHLEEVGVTMTLDDIYERTGL